MGIETEYGILQPGRPGANPMLLSSHVVAVHATARESARARARWDYDDEDPLHDARGFRLQRASAHPSLLTDEPTTPAPSGDGPQLLARSGVEEYDDPGAANVVLTNGARLYVDHAHPEYSSPEVTGPLDGVRWDRAGELVMLASVRALASTPAMPDVSLYKNNVDGKGATYGTHENYLVDRAVPFVDLAARLTPFLVTRQVFTGAGRVGLGQRGEEPGFQLSQRADYIEAEIGLETTLRRPIINTRDEPHADPERWRRLHVIIGDANLLEVATYLKLGTASLVLWLIELAVTDGGAGGALAAIDRLALRDPVHAVHVVSRDVALTERLELVDGGLEVARRRPGRRADHRLVAAGAIELLVPRELVEAAVVHPPHDTRAYFRGEAIARYGGQISAASWDSVIFDVPGAPTLQRVPMRDPLRGTREHVGALLDRSPDAASLLAALGA